MEHIILGLYRNNGKKGNYNGLYRELGEFIPW